MALFSHSRKFVLEKAIISAITWLLLNRKGVKGKLANLILQVYSPLIGGEMD